MGINRRSFLRGLGMVVVSAALLGRANEAETPATQASGPGDWGWVEYGVRDGVAYTSIGIGDNKAVAQYMTSDGQVGIGSAAPSSLLYLGK